MIGHLVIFGFPRNGETWFPYRIQRTGPKQFMLGIDFGDAATAITLNWT